MDLIPSEKILGEKKRFVRGRETRQRSLPWRGGLSPRKARLTEKGGAADGDRHRRLHRSKAEERK